MSAYALASNHSVRAACVCNTTEPYPEWIAVTFRECVITERDSISFWIGFSSLIFWIFAQAPQFWKNCRSGSASGLSLLFLMQWMLGDTLNLCGSILTGQLGTVVYTSGLFVCMDIILFSQYLSLETECAHFLFPCCIKPKRELLVGEGSSHNHIDRPWKESAVKNLDSQFLSSVTDAESQTSQPQRQSRTLYSVFLPLVLVFSFGSLAMISSVSETRVFESDFFLQKEGVKLEHQKPDSFFTSISYQHISAASVGGSASFRLNKRRILSNDPMKENPTEHAQASHHSIPICNASPNSSFQLLGTVLAWASALIYLLSRIPQIVKNIKRGSVEGLSPLMFFCAVMGNSTYAASMFVKGDNLIASLPFLVGSIGTLAFDFTILCQFVYYSGKSPHRQNHLDGPMSERDNVPRGVHGIVDAFASPWSNPHDYRRVTDSAGSDLVANRHVTTSFGGSSTGMGRHGRSRLIQETPGSA